MKVETINVERYLPFWLELRRLFDDGVEHVDLLDADGLKVGFVLPPADWHVIRILGLETPRYVTGYSNTRAQINHCETRANGRRFSSKASAQRYADRYLPGYNYEVVPQMEPEHVPLPADHRGA